MCGMFLLASQYFFADQDREVSNESPLTYPVFSAQATTRAHLKKILINQVLQ
jgi:hypothetical protein